MFKLITILMVAIVGWRQIEGACNTCNSHGFACTGLKTFGICTDGKLDDSVTLECDDDEMCTDLSVVCVPIANSTAIPGCTSRCGVCEPDKFFTCTSWNTYALCSSDGTITNKTGKCPRFKVCDTAGASLCILPCDITSLVCDKDPSSVTPSTPTPPTPTPPTPTPSTPTPSTPTPSTPTPSTPTPSTPSTPTPSTPTPSTPTPSTPTPSTPTPSTPTSPTPTPGPNKPPQTVCNDKKSPGRYPLNDNNNGCDDDYVLCRNTNSTLVAVPTKCPSGRSFNPTTQSCQPTPARCVA